MNIFFKNRKRIQLYTKLDDIDNLANKRIKLIGEIINDEIVMNLKQIENNFKKNLAILKIKRQKNESTQNIINSKIITLLIRKIFNNNNLCQIIDDTNSLSEISHRCRINVRKKEKSKVKNSNIELREIHPSHYKKICPIETSEGKNAGLIWSLTKDAKINEQGFIETPLYVWIQN